MDRKFVFVSGATLAASVAYANPAVSSITGGSSFGIYYGGSTGDVVGLGLPPTRILSSPISEFISILMGCNRATWSESGETRTRRSWHPHLSIRVLPRRSATGCTRAFRPCS